jgi:hypothetical protein
MQQAMKRVRANKGAAGIDGLGIDETAERLLWEWPAIREQLLCGTYRSQPVRRVTIPKPNGGEREPGIPTVTDRLIQQALLQVLQPLLDSTFSQHRYPPPGQPRHPDRPFAEARARRRSDPVGVSVSGERHHGWRILRESGRNWTNGYAIGCGLSN